MPTVVAVDLGAESGRVLRITLDEAGFHQQEIHRFPNQPVQAGGTLYWDALRLLHEIRDGVDKARAGADSLGLDAWGVDFALLDRDGALVANPVHYRDARTNDIMPWVFERIPRREIFERTGLQFMQLNTLYQLAALSRADSPLLRAASRYLSVPDLFLFWLGGEPVCELTHASTTQFYDPRTQSWDTHILSAVNLPPDWFPRIVQPGTQTGEYEGLRIIAPATHDTGSAVVGIPSTSEDFAYISSGTWSLVGLELPAPIVNDAAYAANVTNEGGVFGTTRFLKNVAGLWLVQQCRATWRANGRSFEYADLAQLAEDAPAFQAFIEPEDSSFLAPGDMPSRIRAYCERTGQKVPVTEGEVMRVIYESLALKYRLVLDRMTAASGRAFSRIHVIGGGSQNALLNQMTANALYRPVISGPSEATATGNAMVQFISLGHLHSLAEARELLAKSTRTQTFDPVDEGVWEEAYERYQKTVH
jgi:rhamnulokinase